jgi:hypothetical protein
MGLADNVGGSRSGCRNRMARTRHARRPDHPSRLQPDLMPRERFITPGIQQLVRRCFNALKRRLAGLLPPPHSASTALDRTATRSLDLIMAERLKNFLDFLVSEKVLREALRKTPMLRSFVLHTVPGDYALRLSRSYLIETRSSIVENGKAEIWSVGNIVRIDQSAAFEPAETLTSDITHARFRFRETVKEFFYSTFEPPQTVSGTELLEAVASGLLESDPALEKLQRSCPENPMESVWRTFGAAIHDQLCRRQPLELETIGIFAPPAIESDEIVRFVADEHLLNLIKGRTMIAARQTISPSRRVGPSTEGMEETEPETREFRFLDEERDLYPSDESPYKELIRDLLKKEKSS